MSSTERELEGSKRQEMIEAIQVSDKSSIRLDDSRKRKLAAGRRRGDLPIVSLL